jgi:hypothetical protein
MVEIQRKIKDSRQFKTIAPQQDWRALMGRKPRPSRLATVTSMPVRRRSGLPYIPPCSVLLRSVF